MYVDPEEVKNMTQCGNCGGFYSPHFIVCPACGTLEPVEYQRRMKEELERRKKLDKNKLADLVSELRKGN